MPEVQKTSDPVRFGPFELSVETGELRKNGVRLNLSGQPIEVLTLLVATPGKLVTREELQRRLWPGNSFGDFEKGLNAAVNRLREKLNDSATEPKYIETVPGRGYRFIAKVLGSYDGAAPGKTVSHYRVLENIGRGGMGVVYKAQDLKLGRHVALKFLPEESATNHEALERFRREATTASSLNHPNICTIYEIEEHEGQPFIVMELLQGQTLRECLISSALRRSRLEPVLDTDQLLDIALQILDGLQVAHEKGIIHRDIKPTNIFVTESRLVKILDFGLAKLIRASKRELETLSVLTAPNSSDPPEHLSEVGAAIGTFGYMAPEQARGEDLDARADLFSFGLVVYEMATGRSAFNGTTPGELCHAILTDTPVPIHELNPSIPPVLEQLINKGLEKNRDLRYQSAIEFMIDLMQFKQGFAGRPAKVQKDPRIEPLSYILVAYVPRKSIVERAAEVVVWVRLGAPGDRYYMRQEKEPPPPLGGTFYEREFGLEVRSDASDSHPSTDVLLRLDSPNFEPSSQTKKLSVPGGADSHPCTFLIKPCLAGELVATLDVVDATERVLASRSIRTKALHSENDAVRPEFSLSFGVLRRIYEDLRQYPPNPPELQVIRTPQALDTPCFATACDERQKQWEALTGQVAFGRYKLNELIGYGGSGAVFRSGDLALGSEVAVKIFYALRPSELSALKESTTRSVRALASLSHPNVQKTLDFGVHETAAGDASLFVVSEFIKGETLEDALEFHRLPGCEDVHNSREAESDASDPRGLLHGIQFARQVAAGLLAAHSVTFVGANGFEEHGICHGDIKPSNILVEKSGRAVVVDFMMPDIQGLIASQRRNDQAVRTDEFGWEFSKGRYFYRAPITSIYGTPGFMPPEQELQGIVTRASDIYSFGKTLALLLFDDFFQRADIPLPLRIALAESKLSETVSRLPKFALRDLYIDAARLIDSMTQPQPDERLQDIQAVDGYLMQIEQKCRRAMLRAPKSRTGLLNRLRWRPRKLD